MLAGLNISAVQRLKHTWAALSEATKAELDEVSAVMSPVSSFKALRADIAMAGGNACLPYLGIFLSDLTFTEDGNPDHVGNDLEVINMAKRQLVFKIVQQIQLRQQIAYNFPPVEPIHSFMVNLSYLDENELYEFSMLREPRDADAADIL
jgi:hypothetical protein